MRSPNVLVRHADDSYLGYGRMRAKQPLDAHGADGFAAAEDCLLDPPGDGDYARFVDLRQVPGLEETFVGKRACILLR